MMRVFALFFIAILTVSVSNTYAFTNDDSESRLPDNFHSFGRGILEFQQEPMTAGQCTFAIPNHSVTSVNASEQVPRLNLDGFQHNFFAVLGNNIDNSYHYFQIGLPSGPGFPSYLLDVKKDGMQVHGGFYQDYENLAVLIESDVKKKPSSDDIYKRYFEGESRDITHGTDTYEPGRYSLEAVLVKSDSSYWIKKDRCAIHLDWPFVIKGNGDAVAESPTVVLGKLADVTREFSPLKQYRAGVNPESIDCKPGLRVILQESDDSENKRPACVTPETKAKLIDRGWSTKETKSKHDDISLYNSDGYNNQKLVELLEAGKISEFNILKETLDLNRVQVHLEGANLQGMDLRDINLDRVRLSGANMQNTDLRGMIIDDEALHNVNLQGADLRNADLGGSYLYGANMKDTNLEGAILKGAHLEGADLTGANLVGSDASGVVFTGVAIHNANFQNANLQGSDFSEMTLTGANFGGADMKYSNLKHSNLQNANMKDVDLFSANLENANLRYADMSDSNLHGANLNNANLISANLENAKSLPISNEQARERGAIVSANK